MCVSVWCGVSLSLFLIQQPFFSVLLFFQSGPEKCDQCSCFSSASCSMFFLPGCSSLSLSSPLNYNVCAQSGVTLNPGFNLLSDRRHRRHVCWSDIRQAMTLWRGSVITVMKSKRKELFTSVLFALKDYKHFCFEEANINGSGGQFVLMLAASLQDLSCLFMCFCFLYVYSAFQFSLS